MPSDNEKKRIDVSVNINDSSQFLSALLISLGAYAGESVIRVEGTHGMAYIDMTVRMMEQFGIKVQSENGVYKIAKQDDINVNLESDSNSLIIEEREIKLKIAFLWNNN